MSAGLDNLLPNPNSSFPCSRTHDGDVSASVGPPKGVTDGETSPSPRPVTRGETSRQEQAALIDWLSITLPHDAPIKMPELLGVLRQILSSPDLVAKSQKRGIAGFDESVSLYLSAAGTETDVGRIAWGGETQRGRIWVSCSGTLCARVGDWGVVALALHLWHARITRVDIAHDDFSGSIGLDQIESLYRSGAFNTGGRQPGSSVAGDWMQTSGTGRTFYVGRRVNGKMLRIYEKGKQLGDPLSPWVRWEVEFRATDRLIPFDVLDYPARYLAGAYPALNFVSGEQTRIKSQKKTAKTSLSRLTELASISYGKTVNALRLQGLDANEILSLICRPGLPGRLASPVASMPVGTQYMAEPDGDD